MHVVSNNDSSDHIYDIVSADRGHHKPLVAHDEKHQIVHLEPLACSVLQSDDKAGAYVPRIEEVIRVVINDN
jgi:hypothetical protein